MDEAAVERLGAAPLAPLLAAAAAVRDRASLTQYLVLYYIYLVLYYIYLYLYLTPNMQYVVRVLAGQRHKDVLFALSVVADDQDPQVKPETAILTNSSNLTTSKNGLGRAEVRPSGHARDPELVKSRVCGVESAPPGGFPSLSHLRDSDGRIKKYGAARINGQTEDRKAALRSSCSARQRSVDTVELLVKLLILVKFFVTGQIFR